MLYCIASNLIMWESQKLHKWDVILSVKESQEEKKTKDIVNSQSHVVKEQEIVSEQDKIFCGSRMRDK